MTIKLVSLPLAFAVATLLVPAMAQAQTPAYKVAKTITVGGDGAWDYVIPDTVGHRLFIGRQNRIMVVDMATGTVLGEIGGLNAAHGVALDYATGHGFATSGADSTVVMFDLKTLKPLGRTTAADDADAIIYDPASKRVYTFNGDANSASIIDPVTGKRVGTIPLGGKPEYGATDGAGKLYANIADKGEIAEIDAAQGKVTHRWSVKPCTEPTGIAIDLAHHRLFSGCRNKTLAVSDLTNRKLVTTLPIGGTVDGNAFDPATQNVFSSNGDGTLTVIHEDSPDAYRVVQTLATMPSAKTMGFDPQTHKLYLVSAKFGPVPKDSTAANPRRRPPVLPGTFTLLVVDR
jgi:YVTN family beta-propeller protein